jgi:hypothetical protein
MQDIELYKRILGITPPWVVSEVRLGLSSGQSPWLSAMTVPFPLLARSAEGKPRSTIISCGGGGTLIQCS